MNMRVSFDPTARATSKRPLGLSALRRLTDRRMPLGPGWLFVAVVVGGAASEQAAACDNVLFPPLEVLIGDVALFRGHARLLLGALDLVLAPPAADCVDDSHRLPTLPHLRVAGQDATAGCSGSFFFFRLKSMPFAAPQPKAQISTMIPRTTFQRVITASCVIENAAMSPLAAWFRRVATSRA